MLQNLITTCFALEKKILFFIIVYIKSQVIVTSDFRGELPIYYVIYWCVTEDIGDYINCLEVGIWAEL